MTFNQFVIETRRTRPNAEQNAQAAVRLMNPKAINLLHATLGLVTEAAEIADALKKHLFYGKEIDDVNVIEELGDSAWYSAMAVDALETRISQVLEKNIAKLRARYPEKFTEAAALNRDLEKEREVLECT